MKRRIGERRVILGLFGVPFVLFGVGNLLTNDQLLLAPSVEFMARHLLAWFWIVAGLYAIAAMIGNRGKAVIEEVGYGLLFIPPFVWMAVCAITLIYYPGNFSVFSGFLVAFTLVVLILYLARYMKNG